MTCQQDRARIIDVLDNVLAKIEGDNDNPGGGPGVAAELTSIAESLTHDLIDDVLNRVTAAAMIHLNGRIEGIPSERLGPLPNEIIMAWLAAHLSVMFEVGRDFALRGYAEQVSVTCTCRVPSEHGADGPPNERG